MNCRPAQEALPPEPPSMQCDANSSVDSPARRRDRSLRGPPPDDKAQMINKPEPHPYRPDIDGLRAVAVLLVFFFHAQLSAFPDGFVGVDIFFVISGYLITKIIISECAASTFSFTRFYARRTRRIVPALVIVLIVVAFAGWLILLPNEFAQLGHHIYAAAAFYLNFQLISDINYFDSSATTKPLLHLWSLSVEEQFYVIWPLLMTIVFRLRLDRLAILAALAISALMNIYFSTFGPTFLFYFSPARFWEFSVGAGVNYIEQFCHGRTTNPQQWLPRRTPVEDHKTIFSCAGKHVLSVLGFVLLVLSILIDYGRSVYPSYLTLLPTIGTALLILSREGIFNRLLSSRMLVNVGLISYPLYLWHWPILSFYRLTSGSDEITWPVTLAVLFISTILAVGTYWLIEMRFRWGGWGYIKAAALLLCLGLIGAVGSEIKRGAVGSRFANDPLSQYLDFVGYPTPAGTKLDSEHHFGEIGKNANKRILLLGDSHAEQYRLTLRHLWERHQAEDDAPAILFGLQYDRIPDLDRIVDDISRDGSIKTVVISEFWAIQYGSDRINYSVRCCASMGGSVGGPAHHDPSPEEYRQKLDGMLGSAISGLRTAGKTVFIVLDNPFGEEFAPQLQLRRDPLTGTLHLRQHELLRSDALERTEPIRSRVIASARAYGARIIDPFAQLCEVNSCRSTYPGGAPVYKDYDHLSVETVSKYADYLAEVF
jgi:peptidoglycan/LPS O-acetylase OafA/YrhL